MSERIKSVIVMAVIMSATKLLNVNAERLHILNPAARHPENASLI
jgi:hypothetical protein